MTNLTQYAIQSGYGDILTTTNEGQGLINVLQQVQDGYGNASPMRLATNAVNFDRTGGNTFQIDGVSLTSTVVNINAVCDDNPTLPGNEGVILPIGTTAERPIAPQNGTIRYNSDTSRIEAYANNVWVNIT